MAQLVFDVHVIVVTVISALHRPYRQTAEVMSRLQHDGIAILSVGTICFSRIAAAYASLISSARLTGTCEYVKPL